MQLSSARVRLRVRCDTQRPFREPEHRAFGPSADRRRLDPVHPAQYRVILFATIDGVKLQVTEAHKGLTHRRRLAYGELSRGSYRKRGHSQVLFWQRTRSVSGTIRWERSFGGEVSAYPVQLPASAASGGSIRPTIPRFWHCGDGDVALQPGWLTHAGQGSARFADGFAMRPSSRGSGSLVGKGHQGQRHQAARRLKLGLVQ